MTEAVTSLSANLQQYLLAESQQRAASANSSAEVGANLSISSGSPAIASAADASNPSSKNSKYQQDGQPGQKRTADGTMDTPKASKLRGSDEAVTIEIRDFDIGRTPAEVVGTADVLARFDDNQNGRVDLLESRRAAKARDSSSTFAARGQAGLESSTVAQGTQEQTVEKSVSDRATSETASVLAGQAGQKEDSGQEPKKIYTDSQLISGGTIDDGTVPEKVIDSEAIASQGGFSDGAPVQQKFYGDGAEIVIGRFVANADMQQQLSGQMYDSESGRLYEEGSGEKKLYDKVAQSEPGSFYQERGEEITNRDNDTAQLEMSIYEKAQRLEAQNDVVGEQAKEIKKIYGELDLYASIAKLSEDDSELPSNRAASVTA